MVARLITGFLELRFGTNKLSRYGLPLVHGVAVGVPIGLSAVARVDVVPLVLSILFTSILADEVWMNFDRRLKLSWKIDL